MNTEDLTGHCTRCLEYLVIALHCVSSLPNTGEWQWGGGRCGQSRNTTGRGGKTIISWRNGSARRGDSALTINLTEHRSAQLSTVRKILCFVVVCGISDTTQIVLNLIAASFFPSLGGACCAFHGFAQDRDTWLETIFLFYLLGYSLSKNVHTKQEAVLW